MVAREHARGFRIACRGPERAYAARPGLLAASVPGLGEALAVFGTEEKVPLAAHGEGRPEPEWARGRGRWSADPEKNKEGLWVYVS